MASAAPFQPGSSAVPQSEVEISVSCRNLIRADILSKSDPMVVLFTQTLQGETWREMSRSETIWDNQNPDFVKKFHLTYLFEEFQLLKFEVYDIDSKSRDLAKHDFLGYACVSLGEIVAAPGGKITKKLTNGNKGTIILSSEEVSSCNDKINLRISGHKLSKKDFFGKSDPYLCFYRSNEDGGYTVCHRTEVIKSTLNPRWKPMRLPVRVLCQGDYSRVIKIECYDWNRTQSHKLIGECFVTVNDLEAASSGVTTFDLINPNKKKSKGKYSNSGRLKVDMCSVERCHSFLEFVRGGLQLAFTVAIDFTASNGDPRQYNSLHYIDPNRPNPYQMAIQAVGKIIQDYDTDKLFPCLGFGARIPQTGQVSHEFFLNGHPTNPFVSGVQGILEAYNTAAHSVQLYGPTNFSPVINHVARFAREKQDGTEYFILLIITDGIISDMQHTLKAVVDAASLPMSIIIVGVGEADFAAMEILDGDEMRVAFQGREAERDIVQFVPFKNHINAATGGRSVYVAEAQLAKEVLEEIPDQVTGYMKNRGIQPKPVVGLPYSQPPA